MDSNQSNVLQISVFEGAVQSATPETLKTQLDVLFNGDLRKVSEDDIWAVIAENFSSEWKKANTDLSGINEQLAENEPLGLIGAALDWEEREPLVQRQNYLLAQFTQVNERLKQDKELCDILAKTIKKKKMLERSFNQTQDVRKASVLLHFMDDQPAVKSPFSLRGLFSRRNKKNVKPQQVKIVLLSQET